MRGSGRGSAFLLKIGDPSLEPSFTTVAGLRAERVRINTNAVEVSPISNTWRELLEASGLRFVSIEATGIFTGSAAESRVRAAALRGAVLPYELSFESGERLRGSFLLSALEYAGDFNGERNYRIALESSGEVVAL